MKNIFKNIVVACLLLGSSAAVAQEAKPALESAPAHTSVQENAPLANEPVVSSKPAWSGPRLSYSMAMGASFSNGFGNATYVEPSVRYQVSNRFRVNASMTYLNVTTPAASLNHPEGRNTMLYRQSTGSRYIGSVGVDYLASDRLILSGNIWHDFSAMPHNSFNNSAYNFGKFGADFRATYKVTENFSIMGAFRYSDGASPLYGPFYTPGFNNSRFVF